MRSTLLLSISILTLLLSDKEQAMAQSAKRPNFIDSIRTAQQIENLMLHINKDYHSFKVNGKLTFSQKECQHLSDSLKIKPWTKADFDGNGLTDLLVVGYWDDPFILCVLDQGGKQYQMTRITRRVFQDCSFPLVDTNSMLPAITYYYQSYPERDNWDKPKRLEKKTLVYKFGDFIEANPNPGAHRIEKIRFSTTMCFGTCPVFDIEMKADKTATWMAKKFNKISGKEINGSFKTTIDEPHFKEIVDLLNYIDFETLQSEYAVAWTDDQESTLTITYDDGKTKTITDYGLIGTYGLDRVYELLFQLRENQKWTN